MSLSGTTLEMTGYIGTQHSAPLPVLELEH